MNLQKIESFTRFIKPYCELAKQKVAELEPCAYLDVSSILKNEYTFSYYPDGRRYGLPEVEMKEVSLLQAWEGIMKLDPETDLIIDHRNSCEWIIVYDLFNPNRMIEVNGKLEPYWMPGEHTQEHWETIAKQFLDAWPWCEPLFDPDNADGVALREYLINTPSCNLITAKSLQESEKVKEAMRGIGWKH